MTSNPDRTEIVELKPNIYLFPSQLPGSHAYLIRGSSKNVLIDTSMRAYFSQLTAHLEELGLQPKDIHFVILTHEHFDHIGATSFLFDTAVVAAHRLAANKFELQDEFVTMDKLGNAPTRDFRAHIWLEDNTLIDLGNYKLRALHTPGHTSGCLCLYEPNEQLLFSGDTVFAKGTISDIAASGNVSDYVNSLQRLASLRIRQLYPGHGHTSDIPEEDILRALEYAQVFVEDAKLFFEALAKRGPLI